MALQTPVITSIVTVPQDKLFIVTFRMTVADDDGSLPGIDTTDAIKVRPGDVVDDRVVPVIAAFQKEIDNYQSAAAIKVSQAMTDAITAIENGVSV